jgi:hypothetical protein
MYETNLHGTGDGHWSSRQLEHGEMEGKQQQDDNLWVCPYLDVCLLLLQAIPWWVGEQDCLPGISEGNENNYYLCMQCVGGGAGGGCPKSYDAWCKNDWCSFNTYMGACHQSRLAGDYYEDPTWLQNDACYKGHSQKWQADCLSDARKAWAAAGCGMPAHRRRDMVQNTWKYYR